MAGIINRATIGILIPTFNRREYLEQALVSTINQSYSNLEIIVIDNGSTDGTIEYLTGILDSRVKCVFNGLSLGLIGSINKGAYLFSQKVQWCTILCDDDRLHHKYVESMQDYVLKNGLTNIVLSNISLIDAQGKKIRVAQSSPYVESAFDYLVNRCNSNRETFLTGLFFSLPKFKKNGDYPRFTTGMATDDAFIFRMGLENRLYCCKNAIAYVRIHDSAESHSKYGMLNHIKALYDFKIYIDSVSRDSQLFTAQEIKIISNVIRSFVKKNNSGFWLRNVSALLKRSIVENNELIELVELLDDKRFNFDVRILVFKFIMKNIAIKNKYIASLQLLFALYLMKTLELLSDNFTIYRLLRDNILKILSRITIEPKFK